MSSQSPSTSALSGAAVVPIPLAHLLNDQRDSRHKLIRSSMDTLKRDFDQEKQLLTASEQRTTEQHQQTHEALQGGVKRKQSINSEAVASILRIAHTKRDIEAREAEIAARAISEQAAAAAQATQSAEIDAVRSQKQNARTQLKEEDKKQTERVKAINELRDKMKKIHTEQMSSSAVVGEIKRYEEYEKLLAKKDDAIMQQCGRIKAVSIRLGEGDDDRVDPHCARCKEVPTNEARATAQPPLPQAPTSAAKRRSRGGRFGSSRSASDTEDDD